MSRFSSFCDLFTQVDKAAAPRHGQVTRIRHLGDALFTDVPSEFDTVQYNSLTVKSDSLPDHLEPIAWTTNRGQEEILGLKHRTKPLWGVQYHPEVTYNSSSIEDDLNVPDQFFLGSRFRARTVPVCCLIFWRLLHGTISAVRAG